MPEILAPGVYVTEVAFEATSIEGVSTSTSAFTSTDGLVAPWPGPHVASLAAASPAPAWTCGNDHDPGATLAEVPDWTAQPLAARVGAADRVALHRDVAGIVDGLAVRAPDGGDAGGVTVSPGTAVGPHGRAIEPDARRHWHMAWRDPPP